MLMFIICLEKQNRPCACSLNFLVEFPFLCALGSRFEYFPKHFSALNYSAVNILISQVFFFHHLQAVFLFNDLFCI